MTDLKVGKGGKFHRPNGQFASKKDIGSHLKDIEYDYSLDEEDFKYKSFQKERYREHKKYYKEVSSTVVDTHNLRVPTQTGKYVTRRFAYLFRCTCKVQAYKVKVERKDGSIKEYDRKDDEKIEHYVYLSSNSDSDSHIKGAIFKHHKTHYPRHKPISLDLVSIHEGEILE